MGLPARYVGSRGTEWDVVGPVLRSPPRKNEELIKYRVLLGIAEWRARHTLGSARDARSRHGQECNERGVRIFGEIIERQADVLCRQVRHLYLPILVSQDECD